MMVAPSSDALPTLTILSDGRLAMNPMAAAFPTFNVVGESARQVQP